MESRQISTEFVIFRKLTDFGRELPLTVNSFQTLIILRKIGHFSKVDGSRREIILKDGFYREEATERGTGTMFFIECSLYVNCKG